MLCAFCFKICFQLFMFVFVLVIFFTVVWVYLVSLFSLDFAMSCLCLVREMR